MTRPEGREGTLATIRNGKAGPEPARKHRLDARERNTGDGPTLPRPTSGRRFILISAVVLAVGWGALYFVFRDWRARHRELADYGRAQVAEAVGPLAGLHPPGVVPEEWQQAVDATRRMLADVSASGLLDRPGLDRLRADLDARVARVRTHPEAAVGVLATLWDDMARKTKLRTDLVPRPKLLGASHQPGAGSSSSSSGSSP